mgnify:FL=1|tara:strand:+ start:480 stop:671 length:192 start_codon:yes stop_codon:yes gene_type:complete
MLTLTTKEMASQQELFPRAWTDISYGQYKELDVVFNRLMASHGDKLDRQTIIEMCFKEVDTDY